MARSILVVDDDPAMRDVFNALLTEEGYVTLLACNGADGVTMARATPPDIILMDLIMPVLDGVAAIRELRADCDGRAWRIIAMSAGVGLPAVTREVDIDGMISKPFNFEQMLAEVERCLGQGEPHAPQAVGRARTPRDE